MQTLSPGFLEGEVGVAGEEASVVVEAAVQAKGETSWNDYMLRVGGATN